MLCMLMILYKFNHATAVRGGCEGGGDETPKIGPGCPHKSSVRPPEWRRERRGNRFHLILVIKHGKEEN